MRERSHGPSHVPATQAPIITIRCRCAALLRWVSQPRHVITNWKPSLPGGSHLLSDILSMCLCGPVDCSPPGSSAHGISQARVLQCTPPPGGLPDPGVELWPPAPPALAGGFSTARATWEALVHSAGFDERSRSCFHHASTLRDSGSTPGILCGLCSHSPLPRLPIL